MDLQHKITAQDEALESLYFKFETKQLPVDARYPDAAAANLRHWGTRDLVEVADTLGLVNRDFLNGPDLRRLEILISHAYRANVSGQYTELLNIACQMYTEQPIRGNEWWANTSGAFFARYECGDSILNNPLNRPAAEILMKAIIERAVLTESLNYMHHMSHALLQINLSDLDQPAMDAPYRFKPDFLADPRYVALLEEQVTAGYEFNKDDLAFATTDTPREYFEKMA